MNLLDEYKKWVNGNESPAGPHNVSELLYAAFESGFLLGAAPIIGAKKETRWDMCNCGRGDKMFGFDFCKGCCAESSDQ